MSSQLISFAYGLLFCLWFLLKAWGSQFAWFDAAFVSAMSGIFLPIPILGPLLLGKAIASCLV
ncbi:MAG: hypothetical protein F6J87_09255 [Spirulina sp. SIO3F2]|nr:hypothetical protein [Spirulina sp. SIO3F2]